MPDDQDLDNRVFITLSEDDEAPPAAPAPAPLPDDGEAPGGAPEAQGLPKGAELLPSGDVRLTLRKPVVLQLSKAGQVREETYAALTLRRPTGADLRAMQAAGDNAPYVVLSRVSGIAQARFDAMFDRMDIADCTAALRVIDYFLDDGPKTGR